MEDETPEILFIANVHDKSQQEEWQRVPMKVKLGDYMIGAEKKTKKSTRAGHNEFGKNMFKDMYGCCNLKYTTDVLESVPVSTK